MDITSGDGLSAKKGIKRYGQAIIPMDEAPVIVVVDILNRPYLAYRVPLNGPRPANLTSVFSGDFSSPSEPRGHHAPCGSL